MSITGLKKLKSSFIPHPNKIGICNVDLLLEDRIQKNSSIFIENGTIKAIGEPPQSDYVDGEKALITPGFINAHTHAAMSYLRDLSHTGDDDLISNLFFRTEKQLQENLVEKLSYSFLLSALRSGTTCIFDHYYFSAGVAKALERLGMRGCIGETLGDLGGAFPSEKALENALHKIDQWPFSSRIRPLLAPHAIDTVSEKLGKEITKEARKRNLPMHFHISQRKSEYEGALKNYNKTPVMLAHERGWLWEKSLAVHLLYVNAEDIKLLKETNTTVVNCPSSQIIYEKLAPIELFSKAKIPLALGTDSNASSDQANLLSELKLFTLLLKDRGVKNLDLYKRCMESITTIPAQVVQPTLGKLCVGAPADFVVMRQDLENLPLRDPWTHIIFSMESSHVEHVMVDGKWVLWDRKPTACSIEELQHEYENALKQMKV